MPLAPGRPAPGASLFCGAWTAATCPMHAVAPAVMGELLGRACTASCAVAWQPRRVDAWRRAWPHDTRHHGLPAACRGQMITHAVSRRARLLRRPLRLGAAALRRRPGIFSVNGTDISAVVDWGGRPGRAAPSTTSAAGQRTARPNRSPLPAYTAAFLHRATSHSNSLPAEGAAAVPLFQRLRIASRACYVTTPDTLAGVQSWMQRAFDEQAPGLGRVSPLNHRVPFAPAFGRNDTRQFPAATGEAGEEDANAPRPKLGSMSLPCVAEER